MKRILMEDIKIEKFTVYDIESEYSKFTSIDIERNLLNFLLLFYCRFNGKMASWKQGIKTVLEPAFGLGVLSRALLNYNENLK